MEARSGSPPLLKPLARRPFSHASNSESHSSNTPPSSESTNPSTSAFLSRYNDGNLTPESPPATDSERVPRSRSILNLTSSTLFGIYAPTALNDSTSTPQTPWGTGAETPARSESMDGLAMATNPPTRGLPNGDELARRLDNARNNQPNGRPVLSRRPTHTLRPSSVKILLCNLVLFGIGMGYGALVARLHSSKRIPSVQISQNNLSGLDTPNIVYSTIWGLSGIVLGNLLPYIDSLNDRTSRELAAKNAVGWIDMIRGIGSFVGVAFAIRRLPWETTLQLSLTLSLANPLLWYLLDRTTSGLLLSSTIGGLGTIVLLLTNPNLIPAPTLQFAAAMRDAQLAGTRNATYQAERLVAGDQRNESIAVATWIASVLFCSCVCFGNVGRLLSGKEP